MRVALKAGINCISIAQDQGANLRSAASAGLDVGVFKQVLKAACATVKDDQQQLLRMVNSQDEVRLDTTKAGPHLLSLHISSSASP